MNKLLKLCEYGINVNTVLRLKKYSVEELKYAIKSDEDLGIVIQSINKQKILNILESEHFIKDESISTFELLDYGLNERDINILIKERINIEKIVMKDIESFQLSPQLKRKLKIILPRLKKDFSFDLTATLLEVKVNKLYKLCEYGIPLNTVVRLKKFSVEELCDNIDILKNVDGIGKSKIDKIYEIITSEEFINDSDGSIYLLNELGIESRMLDKLFDLGITLSSIQTIGVENMGIPELLKEKIKCIKNMLEDVVFTSDDEAKKIFLKNVRIKKLESIIRSKLLPFECKNILELRNMLLNNSEYDIDNFFEDLNELKNQSKIYMSTEGIYYKTLCLDEALENIEDERRRKFLRLKLEGKTLNEIGEEEGLTRERVRQILEKELRRLPKVNEDKYKYIFMKYNWSKELFINFYHEKNQTYEYLDLKYSKGKKDTIDLYNEVSNELQEKVLDEYYGIITIYDEKIKNTSDNILEFFVKNEAKELIELDDIYNKFVNFCKKNGFDFPENVRNFEGRISRKNFILNNINKKIRYYNFSNITEKHIIELKRILDCDVGEYSTYYFLKNYPELMEEIDIKDEYELHNLIRLLDIKLSDTKRPIVMSKMPHLFIGNIDKKEFYEFVLKELSPITIEDACEYLFENYGHKTDTAAGYIRTEFRKYINGEEISFENKLLDKDTLEKIKLRIGDDLCTIRNAKEIFEMFLGKKYVDYFNSLNLNAIGYKIKSNYIQKNSILNLEEYILDFIKDKKIIYADEIPLNNSNAVYNIIRSCEYRFDIIEMSKDKYINFKVLESAGITKEDLIAYGERAKKEFEPGEFFTLYHFKNRIGECELDYAGFEDKFYESLLFYTNNIKKITLDSNDFFYISKVKDRHEYAAKDIIKDLVEENNGIELVELIQLLEEKYGIKINNEYLIIELIRKNDFYYSNTLRKVYISKEEYLNEIYEED